jgi:hypothetical protein
MERDGIPGAAIRFEQTNPIFEAATLQGLVRPVRGGLQIAWPDGDSSFVCTLGFNTFDTPSTVASFITNSHCTRNRGSASPATLYYQPTISSSQFVGAEVEDPPFFTAPSFGCPAGKVCRRSDAARANYLMGTYTLGRIMRTTGENSITIAGTAPDLGTWNIRGEGVPVVGMNVHKTGRTTGWDFGRVNHTCVNVKVMNTNITMICQDKVGAPSSGPPIVGPGDSGAPVFSRIGTTFFVTLLGILWGGDALGTEFTFSRMSLIEAELGAQQTF